MTQEIKIPVSANTAAAEKGLEDLAGATDAIADAMKGVASSTKDAAAGVRQVADETERLMRARELLSRELGRDISQTDAATALENFDRLRRSRNALGRGARNFTDFEGWALGHRSLYRTPGEVARHRSFMLSAMMEGTDDTRTHGGPPPPRPPEEPGGSTGGGSTLQKLQSTAMGFSRSMLALAGITSVMALASKAAELAGDEATSADTLKRRMGDLGVDFERLRSQARAAGEGLGVTYVESQRLAKAYGNEVGNLGKTDLEGQGLQNHLHTAYGFARSYGTDPAAAVQFFGQMARYGIGRDERDQRKLAMLIGDSVARSGYGGKVDELLQAVADYTATSARMSLTVPNAAAFANAITSLSSRGLAGLDPQNAAALLSTADAATRRGGAMGEASLNFNYAALRNYSPGMNPVQALALMEGGLFGTSRQVFGSDSPLANYMGKGVKLDDVTNFDKMMPLMRSHYGNGGYLLNAIKNHFGLSSHAQAAALADMSSKGMLGATSSLMDSMKLDPMLLSATGFQMVGQLANAKGRDGLDRAFNDILARKDISDEQKKVLVAAASGASGGGDEAVRRAMVAAVAQLNISQEKTKGTEVRDSIADLTNKLTQAGGPLLSVLNPIRDSVVAIAERFVPGYMDLSGTRPVDPQHGSTAPWAGGNSNQPGAANPGRTQFEQDAMRLLMSKGRSKMEAAAIVGNWITESNLDPLASNNLGGGHRGIAQWDKHRWRQLLEFAKKRGLDPNALSTQVLFGNEEITHGAEFLRAQRLPYAKSIEEATGIYAGVERPENFDPLYPERSRFWDRRVAQARRLAGMPLPPQATVAAAGPPRAEHHVVEVVAKDSQGRETGRKNVHLPTSAGAPRPAGATGGRAPLVRGTISYPVDRR